MLVISSQTQSVYRHHKAIWETYMKSHPDIECYFIEFSPVVLSPLLTSTTLFLRGHDTYQTILDNIKKPVTLATEPQIKKAEQLLKSTGVYLSAVYSTKYDDESEIRTQVSLIVESMKSGR